MSKIGTAELGTARDESVHDIEDSLAQQIPGHDSSHYREGRIRPNQRDHATSGKKHREQGVRPTPAPCRRSCGEQLARHTDKQDDTEQYRDGPCGCQLELKYRQGEQSPGDPHSQNKPPRNGSRAFAVPVSRCCCGAHGISPIVRSGRYRWATNGTAALLAVRRPRHRPPRGHSCPYITYLYPYKPGGRRVDRPGTHHPFVAHAP